MDRQVSLGKASEKPTFQVALRGYKEIRQTLFGMETAILGV